MISRKHLLWMLVVTLSDWVLAIVALTAMPRQVPVHWDIQGRVDGLGSSAELALVFPFTMTAILVLLVGIGAAARGSALDRSREAYGRFAVSILGMFMALHAVFLLAGLGKPVNLPAMALAMVGFLWLVLGNMLGKIRRNTIMGIRTPWTLKSDVVWERTHRMGGPLMVTHGLLILLAALLCPWWITLVVFFAGTVLLVFWALFYSWRLSQHVE